MRARCIPITNDRSLVITLVTVVPVMVLINLVLPSFIERL